MSTQPSPLPTSNQNSSRMEVRKKSALQQQSASDTTNRVPQEDSIQQMEEQGLGKFILPVAVVGTLLAFGAFGIVLLGLLSQYTSAPAPLESDEVFGQVARERQVASAKAQELPVFIRNSIGMEFAWCPPGDFLMGTPDTDAAFRSTERQHFVRLTRGFYMSQHEVTAELFQQIMCRTSSSDEDAIYPATNVTWNEAFEFCVRLTRLEKEWGHEYRLPTEAEWEYACRADSTTAWFFGSTPTELGRYGWVRDNKDSRIRPVGRLMPNPWGLFDMYGNTWEWCADNFDSYPFDELSIDPKILKTGTDRVRRGGSAKRYPVEATSSSRNALKANKMDPETGFRVVRTISPELVSTPMPEAQK